MRGKHEVTRLREEVALLRAEMEGLRTALAAARVDRVVLQQELEDTRTARNASDHQAHQLRKELDAKMREVAAVVRERNALNRERDTAIEAMQRANENTAKERKVAEAALGTLEGVWSMIRAHGYGDKVCAIYDADQAAVRVLGQVNGVPAWLDPATALLDGLATFAHPEDVLRDLCVQLAAYQTEHGGTPFAEPGYPQGYALKFDAYTRFYGHVPGIATYHFSPDEMASARRRVVVEQHDVRADDVSWTRALGMLEALLAIIDNRVSMPELELGGRNPLLDVNRIVIRVE